MNFMKQRLALIIIADGKWINEKPVTKLDIFEPVMSKSKDGDCNPLFFKP